MAGPGRGHRESISLFELTELFPDEASAERWFIEQRWPDGIRCAFCESDDAKPVPQASQCLGGASIAGSTSASAQRR